MNQLVSICEATSPTLITAAGERARARFIEFFTANIRNVHTRRAYAQAAQEFLAWCESANVASIAAVKPVHVAAYVEQLNSERAAPTVKLRLAALRHLFDWLVVGQVIATNPAASVRGPQHIVKKGKTPVLTPKEARRLLDGIDLSTHTGLRDRALIGLMIYSFARIGAALSMKVQDVYVQNRRLWVRLHEKGASVMRCRATITSRVSWRPIWMDVAFERTSKDHCFAPSVVRHANRPARPFPKRTPMP